MILGEKKLIVSVILVVNRSRMVEGLLKYPAKENVSCEIIKHDIDLIICLPVAAILVCTRRSTMKIRRHMRNCDKSYIIVDHVFRLIRRSSSDTL